MKDNLWKAKELQRKNRENLSQPKETINIQTRNQIGLWRINIFSYFFNKWFLKSYASRLGPVWPSLPSPTWLRLSRWAGGLDGPSRFLGSKNPRWRWSKLLQNILHRKPEEIFILLMVVWFPMITSSFDHTKSGTHLAMERIVLRFSTKMSP